MKAGIKTTKGSIKLSDSNEKIVFTAGSLEFDNEYFLTSLQSNKFNLSKKILLMSHK